MKRPTALHILDRYLFVTGSWIYSQLVGITTYRTAVVAQGLENLDIFPLADVSECPPAIRNPGSRCERAINQLVETVFGFERKKQAQIVHESRAVLLHAHFGPAGYRALALKRATGLPLVTTFYGADACLYPNSSSRWRRRYRRLFEQGDLFLAEGDHMKQTLVSLGCPSEKVVVQHLGVDLNLIAFALRRPAKDGTVNIISVGSFREKKGLIYAVRAFARVAHKRPNVRLVIVGDGRSRPELQIKAELLRAIDEERIGDRVRITGYIPYGEFLHEVRNAQICLQPSVVARDGDAEGGAPVCLIEMSASGLPVIATRHCDITQVVLDGRSGFLVAERDVDALAKRLLYVVDHPDAWKAMADAGRKHIEENYNLAMQIPRLEGIYDRLTSTVGSNPR